MKFEHLIQINDPLNPLNDFLTRDQLWRGLVLRAQQPTLFVPHLDQCIILESGPDRMARSLRYGELTIIDLVLLTPQQQVLYQVSAQKDIQTSSLCMTIEESQPDCLFVRFSYDDGQSEAEDGANAMYNDFRRSAYEESDIDTISMIRQLAAEGSLDAPQDE